MKLLTGRAFAKLLERHGWQLLRIEGSHHIYGKPGERARISVPVHRGQSLKIGLQRHIMKLAGIEEKDLS